jgi:hypothetical protein
MGIVSPRGVVYNENEKGVSPRAPRRTGRENRFLRKQFIN